MTTASVMTMAKPFVRKDLVEVKESPIHGRGLFARAAIPRDTVLGVLKTKPARGDGPYVLWLDDEGEERYRVLCDLRYINHAKKPNVAYYDDLTVVALKNIKTGQELLHDYGEDWS
ncbi:SET domain-containing protein [Alloalcanivorax sp. C16-2]|uniref:SET domain-containing protein n=1 Tax=Alloalcanivorax TaxID=3020832 RepID=UPI003083DC43